MDKSINHLPLFLFDVKTTEVSFQCSRRRQPPTTQRVFLADGPRSESQPRAWYQRPQKEKKNSLVKTRFTWEPQSITVQSDSFAGLTNHVSTRSDKHSEEEIVQDIMKPAEQRLNCTVTGGSMVKQTTLVEHHFDIQRAWSRCGQFFRHALNKFKEHGRATCDTAYTLVDADVTLHEAQERIDVNSPLASQAEKLIWNNTSAKRKRSAPTVMMFSSGSTEVLLLSELSAVDVSFV